MAADAVGRLGQLVVWLRAFERVDGMAGRTLRLEVIRGPTVKVAAETVCRPGQGVVKMDLAP